MSTAAAGESAGHAPAADPPLALLRARAPGEQNAPRPRPPLTKGAVRAAQRPNGDPLHVLLRTPRPVCRVREHDTAGDGVPARTAPPAVAATVRGSDSDDLADLHGRVGLAVDARFLQPM